MNGAETSSPRVAVIGAGIAGIGAARELRAHGIEVVVLERADRIGGRVHTLDVAGIAVDVGAQFLVPFQTQLWHAAHAAGLDPGLHAPEQPAAVVHGGRAWRIDQPVNLLRTGLLPWHARARIPLLALPVLAAWRCLDTHRLPAAAPLDVRSAAHLARRWGGRDVTERLVAPVVRGLLYWDLPTTSQALLLLLLRITLSSRRRYRLDGGFTRLPQALARDLDVRLGAEVAAVRRAPDGAWEIESSVGPLRADGVVCATTADVAAAIVPDLPAGAVSFLRSVTYSRTAVVTVEVERGVPLPKQTLVFTEADPLLASVNPVPRGADGRPQHPLVRVFLSDLGVRTLGHLDDVDLAAATLDAVRAGRAGWRWAEAARPVAVWRWDTALPRFDVGSVRAPAIQDPASIELGTLALCGDYLGGPFLEGAFTSGRAAAARLLTRNAW